MKRIAIIITILTLWCTLPAQTNYTFITHHNVVKDSYNFWVSVPDTYDEKAGDMPVVLFLHGASLCGNDLNRVRKYGCLDAISMGRDINAIIIAPQNPGGAWNSVKVLNILNWVTRQYAVDTILIYYPQGPLQAEPGAAVDNPWHRRQSRAGLPRTGNL